MYRVYLIAFLFGISFSTAANAWFIIFPIPNLGKPAPLNTLIDALEQSEETKAVAYASEDKVFGSKMWVWGQYSGHVTQAEADRIALSQCEASLANAKRQAAGGKPLYDFGNKKCELHDFVNKTISSRATEQRRATDTTTTTPPPAVSSSYNTKVGIELPDGWEPRPLSDTQKADGYILYAGNPKTNTVMALVVRKREGINDMGAFVTSRRATVANSLKEAQQSEVVSLTVNGLPAWRFDVTGLVNPGTRVTYLHTFLDAGSDYIWISTWTPAAAFQGQRPSMEKLAEGLTGFTQSIPVVAAPTPPIPAAQTPVSTMIDFNSEARKSARILGCITSDLKVVGVEEKNVVFLASCEGGASLALSCDPTGLCLKK